MFLFFDTETTGLPKNWKAPLEDLGNWPRLVQLGWLLTDENGKELRSVNRIIKPEGFIIPEAAASVHGITTEQAKNEGESLDEVLDRFVRVVEEAKALVAHNMSFDEMIMGAELLRKKIDHSMPQRPRICTMRYATDYCAIETSYGYKWPKLIELHYKLFGKGFAGAHDALADVRATARCFFELIDRKVI